jgi:hypothetical protein
MMSYVMCMEIDRAVEAELAQEWIAWSDKEA